MNIKELEHCFVGAFVRRPANVKNSCVYAKPEAYDVRITDAGMVLYSTELNSVVDADSGYNFVECAVVDHGKTICKVPFEKVSKLRIDQFSIDMNREKIHIDIDIRDFELLISSTTSKAF